MPPTKVVFLGADPIDQRNQVDLQRELEGRRRSMHPALADNRMRLTERLEAEPLDVLRYLIDEEPQIVHFSGHGGPNGHLAFEKNGVTSEASPEMIHELFRALQNSVWLVFLNACYSERQADALLETTSFVVGMNDEIEDEAASIFSELFYRVIAAEGSVQEAFDAGIAALSVLGKRTNIPVLRPRRHADTARRLVVGPESPDRLTRRSIELRPPPGLTPREGYRYWLKMVREGRDRDNRPLIDVDREFIGDGEVLRCEVEYAGTWGLQFRCFMESPGETPADERLPANWIDRSRTEFDGRIWFRLDEPEKYDNFDTESLFKNNYLRHRPLDTPERITTDDADTITGDETNALPDRRAEGATVVAPEPPVAESKPSAADGGASAPLADTAIRIITPHPDEFIRNLLPGDVLLLDSLHPVSGLIQFVENRPVNHAALYLEKGECVHVTVHKAGEPAARKLDLHLRLSDHPGPYDRTVTAFRHVDVISKRASAKQVVDRAEEYLTTIGTRYANLSLIAMLPGCLRRSYNAYLAGGKVPVQTLGRLLQLVSALTLSLVSRGSRVPDARVRPGKIGLTCSAFVYRCYAESGAGLNVQVTDPLRPWGSGRPLPSRGGAGTRAAGGTLTIDEQYGVVDGVDLIGIDASLRSMLEGPSGPASGTRAATGTVSGESASAPAESGEPDGLVPERLDDAGLRSLYAAAQDLAFCEAQFDQELISHNNALDGYGPRVRGGRPRDAVPGQVIPDLVTPRDFWASPSFQAVAILHRPPDRAVDSDLDAVH